MQGWKLVEDTGETDPYLNLALEEVLVRGFDGEDAAGFLLFYINRPSVIVGKHQNIIEEVNRSN